MKRLAKKNRVTQVPSSRMAMPLAARSEGRRKMPSGISGSLARRSMTMKETSRIAERMNPPTTRPVGTSESETV